MISTTSNVSFDPEAMHAMSLAFDIACEALRGLGQVDSVQEIVATQIVGLAQEGERDPIRLCERALHGLGIEDVSNQFAAA